MPHKHSHASDRKLINRMAKIVGHTNSIKNMIEEGRDCSEVLIQIAAVRSALNSVGKMLMKDHLNHCVIEALKTDDEEQGKILEELTDAIDKFVR